MSDEIAAERDRLRAVVEAVRPYMTLLPVEVAEGVIGIEPIAYADQERDRMRSALADISAAVMPDIGHGGNYGFVVASAEAVVAERDRLRAVMSRVAHTLGGIKAPEPVGARLRDLKSVLWETLYPQLDAEDGTVTNCPHGELRHTCYVCDLEAERDRLRAAMVPMLGAFKAQELYLTAARAGEAPAEGAMAVIAAGVDMMRQAVEKHGTIERQLDVSGLIGAEEGET